LGGLNDVSLVHSFQGDYNGKIVMEELKERDGERKLDLGIHIVVNKS
jgi:hypothetical protein